MQDKLIEYEEMERWIVKEFIKKNPSHQIRRDKIVSGEFGIFWDKKEKEWHNERSRNTKH